MALVNFVTFVVLKILQNFFHMQNNLNTNNCRRKQNFDLHHDLTFILNVLFQNLAFILPTF